MPRTPGLLSDFRGSAVAGRPPASAAHATTTRRLEPSTLAVISVYALVGTLVLPELLLQDGWLALVAGREIVAHGLHHTNELTVWARGEEWIDQQWLAQLVYYGLAAFGGIKAVLLGHLLLLGVTFTAILQTARAQGASAAAAALTAVPALFIAPWAMQVRPQTLALPLFVALLALLLADARRRSKQVFLVLPLLVLWANIHGTVLLGVAIVGLYATTSLLQRPRMPVGRAGLLVAGAAAAAFATPYGLEITGYYHQMLLNPLLPEFVSEWRPTKLSIFTLPFYALAGATLYLLGRVGRTLTRFEQLLLLALLANALLVIRNITWFALAALIILPRALDAAAGAHIQKPLPLIGSYGRRIAMAAALVGSTAVVVAAGPPRELGGTLLARRRPARARCRDDPDHDRARRPALRQLAPVAPARAARPNRLRHPVRAARPPTVRPAHRLSQGEHPGLAETGQLLRSPPRGTHRDPRPHARSQPHRRGAVPQ